MSNISLGVKNWIRFHLLGKDPICECGEKMVQRGFPKLGKIRFKCIPCSRKEEAGD